MAPSVFNYSGYPTKSGIIPKPDILEVRFQYRTKYSSFQMLKISLDVFMNKAKIWLFIRRSSLAKFWMLFFTIRKPDHL